MMKLRQKLFYWIAIVVICVQIASTSGKKLTETHKRGGPLSGSRTFIKQIGCSSSTSSTLGISDVLSSLSTMISNWFNPSQLTNLTGNFSLPNFNISSIVNKDNFNLTNFNTLSIPLIFCISVIVGVIAAIITLIIPAAIEPDNLVNNMMDTMYGYIQQATSDVSNQYGVPDQYSQQDTSFTHQQNVYSPPTAYSSQGPSSSYNVPASTNTDPSSSYDSQFHKRYNSASVLNPDPNYNYNPQYSSLSSNYLRSEKAKRK